SFLACLAVRQVVPRGTGPTRLPLAVWDVGSGPVLRPARLDGQSRCAWRAGGQLRTLAVSPRPAGHAGHPPGLLGDSPPPGGPHLTRASGDLAGRSAPLHSQRSRDAGRAAERWRFATGVGHIDRSNWGSSGFGVVGRMALA